MLLDLISLNNIVQVLSLSPFVDCNYLYPDGLSLTLCLGSGGLSRY